MSAALKEQPAESKPFSGTPKTSGRAPSEKSWRYDLAGGVIALVLMVALPALRLLLCLLPRRRKPQAHHATFKILVTGKMENPNWCRAHLMPFAKAGNVSELVMIVDGRLSDIPKSRTVRVPKWLRQIRPRPVGRSFWAVLTSLREKPDIVMAYSFFPGGLFGLVAARLVGAVSVVQLCGGEAEITSGGYNNDYVFLPRLLRPYLVYWCNSLAGQFDAVVVRGAKAAAYVREHSAQRRIEILPGTIDPERYHPGGGERKVDIAFIGNVILRKQPWEVCEIAHRVAQRHPDLRVVVAGEGPLLPDMKRQARELQLEENIDFPGHVEKIEELVGRSKIFLMPSKCEGLSIALAEAMAAGAVPVAADVGDQAELVRNGQTGWLVPPGDLDGYARKICDLLEHDQVRTLMSRQASRLAVDNNGIDAVTRRWEKFLAECVVSNQPRAGGWKGVIIGLLLAVFLTAGRIISHYAALPRPKRRNGQVRVLITGRVDNKNWILSHLTPLIEAANVSEILMVVDGSVCADGGKVRQLHMPGWIGWIKPRAMIRSFWSMVVVLREKPDIVMGYGLFPPGFFALTGARLVGAEAMVHLVGGPQEIESGGWMSETIEVPRSLVRRLTPLCQNYCRGFDTVIVRGQKAADYLRERCAPSRIEIVPGSVDPARFRSNGHRRTIDVIFVGRIVPIKQPAHVCEIMARVAARRAATRCLIIGGGPLLDEMKRRVQDMGLSSVVDFAGQIDAVEQYLTQSRVFLLTSRSEGLSIAMAEAMIAGAVPVVADVGDLSELVINGQTGWLIKPGDFDGYAERICDLLDNSGKWAAMSEQASKRAFENNGLPSVTQKWQGLFASPV